MRRRRTSSLGFSFVELLFAITVLGIGFIMLAAIFPVGLRQTKAALDETVGAGNARGMAAKLQQIGQATVIYNTTSTDQYAVLANTFEPRGIPGTAGTKYSGQVRTLNDARPFVSTNAALENTDLRRYNAWQSMANDLISPANTRNGSVVLYKRDAIGLASGAFTPATSAQVIVINTQNVNRTEYTADDVTGPKPATISNTTATARPIFNLEARPVAVQMVYDAETQNYVASFFSVMNLDKGSGGTADHVRGGYPAAMAPYLNAAVNALAEGTFVVISDDRIVAPAAAVGRLNGRIYKLGARRTDLAGVTFDLAPGYGFTIDPGADNALNDRVSTPNVISTDDLVGIGVDKETTTFQSGITTFDPKKPFGNNGPDGSNVQIAGSDGKKGAVALVVGRGFTGPATPANANGYAGAAMDVSAYTTFVSVPKP